MARTGAAAPERPLTRQRILEAALSLVNADGLSALSMRKLGAELGVDPMSVYRHVANKDALLDGIAEQLWVEIRDAMLAGSDWADQLRAFARTMRATMHGHPQAASLLLSRCNVVVAEFEIYATLLDTLREAGFDEAVAARAVRSVNDYVIGYVSNELYTFGAWGAEPADEVAADAPIDPKDYDTTDVLLWLGQTLPPGTPSRIVNAALAMINTYLDGDDFDASLDVAIQGLRQLQDDARN